MQTSGGITIIFLLLTIAVSPARLKATQESNPDRYVLIHLDGVSSYYLESEMEAGNLPNLEKTFSSGGIIEKAVTYFPSKTPIVISSLRHAISAEESRLASWSGIDRQTGEVFTGPNTFWRMILDTPRIAASSLLYGIPLLDRLAGPALSNIPDLIDDYRVLEFYWYPIDAYGHFYGEEAYLKKLRAFDKHFGRLMKRLNKDVNIIIYADHGMTFGEGINTHEEIKDLIGDHARAISYPNLYLEDLGLLEETARKLVDETNIDYTFFRSNENEVTGFHKKGSVHIDVEGEGIRYSFDHEDPFGYTKQGYTGEYLSADEWLELTYDLKYPVTPVKVYHLMSNPTAGDIITLLDVTKYSQTLYSKRGNHGGFTYRDMTIPVLLKGPDMKSLYNRKTIWLEHLFREIDNVSFGYTPSRDDHYLSWWYNVRDRHSTLNLALSPAYRWAIGGEAAFSEPFDNNRYQAWGKFDLMRSYLARFWVGTGVDFKDNNIRPMVFIRHELRYHRFTARTSLSTAGNHYFTLGFRITDPVILQVTNFNSAGIRLQF